MTTIQLATFPIHVLCHLALFSVADTFDVRRTSVAVLLRQLRQMFQFALSCSRTLTAFEQDGLWKFLWCGQLGKKGVKTPGLSRIKYFNFISERIDKAKLEHHLTNRWTYVSDKKIVNAACRIGIEVTRSTWGDFSYVKLSTVEKTYLEHLIVSEFLQKLVTKLQAMKKVGDDVARVKKMEENVAKKNAMVKKLEERMRKYEGEISLAKEDHSNWVNKAK